MAGKGWSRRSYGCAVSGGECLALSLRYHVSERRLRIEDAWFGRLSDKGFVSRLTRMLGRKPLWIPLDFTSESERSDVKVCAIDDAEGSLSGSRLNDAVTSQLQAVEANKKGDYIRTHARFLLKDRRTHVVGASVPRVTVDKTIALWAGQPLLSRLADKIQEAFANFFRSLLRRPPVVTKAFVPGYGVLTPCLGSTRAALVNLFLALHPAAAPGKPVTGAAATSAPAAAGPGVAGQTAGVPSGKTAASEEAKTEHRLLAYRAADADLFCYLQGQAFMDSGASPWVVGGFQSSLLLDHLGAWGSEFAQKYRLTQSDHVTAYVLGADALPAGLEDVFNDPSIQYWEVPWEEENAIAFASGAVKTTVLGQRTLAFTALGMALHGV